MRLGWLVLLVGTVGCFNPDDPPADTETPAGSSSTASSMTVGSATNSTTGTTSTTPSSSTDPTVTAGESSTTVGPTTGDTTEGSSTTAEPIPECGNGVIEAGQVCFAATMTLMVGPSPLGVATEQIDGDSVSDFAVSMSSGRLLTFLSDGAGTFTQTVTEDPDPLGWGRVALGAIADSNVDAIVCEPGNLGMIRFRGFGDGSYSAGSDIGTCGGRVRMLDLDGDGVLEVLAGVEFGVAVYRGAADETFDVIDVFDGDGPPDGFDLADFDGDMDLDLVVTGNSNTVGFLRGNGDGTFAAVSMLATVGNGRDLVAGDFDGDGSSDFAVSSGPILGVHFGNGDGTFAPPVERMAGAPIGAMSAADVDGDGIDDILCGTNALEVFLGADNQAIAAPVVVSTNVTAGDMDVGDFNDDGAVDVVLTNGGDLNVAVVLSNP